MLHVKYIAANTKYKIRKIQSKDMVLDFSIYFNIKSLSFAKINPREKYKTPQLQKLEQAKVLPRICTIFTSK